jgi:hypothetical protein
VLPLLLHIPTTNITASCTVASAKQMFKNQHIKMKHVMYELNSFECCLRLTDMFQVCSKSTFRNKGCSSKIKDVYFLTLLMVIIEPKMLTTTMKQWNRTMV